MAGYRPCKRCHPLAFPGGASVLIKKLLAAVEDAPERRWKDADFRALGADSSTVRRHFKKRFGLTFVAYARARRMGLALQKIRSGTPVIHAQLDSGYDSGSGFRDAFSRVMGAAPNTLNTTPLHAEWIDTPLGPMVAIADDNALYLLEFTDRRGLEREVERLRQRLKRPIVPGRTPVTDAIEDDLAAYFRDPRHPFSTPVRYPGSAFQTTVWTLLKTIPCGATWTYAHLALMAGNPNSARAVGRANGANQLALIIPCHRVICKNGDLGGYGGTTARKRWLLDHEQSAPQP